MRLYRRAMGYFIPDVLLIALLIVLISLSVCVAMLEAWPLAILIDSVLNAYPRGDRVHDVVLSVLPQDRVGQILGLVLLTLALQCVGYATWLGRMMVNAHLSAHGTARVRCDLFSKLQGLGLAYHQRHPKGDATYRLMTDVAGPWGIMELVIGTGVAAVTLMVMTAILFVRSAPLTMAAFAVGPLMIASNWYFARRILKNSLTSKQADAALTSLIQQSIATVSLARAFGREAHELGRFSAHVDRSNGALISLSWQEQLYPFMRDVILAVSAAIIFGYGGYLVYRDQFVDPVAGGMTVGALVVFMDYTRKLWDPLKWLTEFVAKVQYHAAACRRVFDVLDTPNTVEEAPNAIALPVKPRALVLDRVSFGYGAGQMILHNLSARIRPGEMVGFVGPSGTGKSTVLSLMMRAYDPTGGALRLDNIDLRQLRFSDLRQHMAVVGQDHALLPISVADNIAYSRPHATRQEILQAAKLAGAAEFIAGLPEGYDTLLCEGGQNLSGGQRQRLAIARALLTEAPILILDEPTSALDPLHEQHLIDTLGSLRGRRTIVLVTHHLESVVDCDQIYVMDAGRIVEHGHHAALLAERGRYSRLWQRLDAPAKPPLPVAAVA